MTPIQFAWQAGIRFLEFILLIKLAVSHASGRAET
jgi:hypothetical protein